MAALRPAPYFGDASWIDWRRQLDINTSLSPAVVPEEVAVYRRFLAKHVNAALGANGSSGGFERV